MVSAISLAVLGIAITAFFGLGGVDIAKAQISNIKSSLPKFGTSGEIKSQRVVIQSTPGEKPTTLRSPAPTVSPSTGVLSNRGKQKKPFTKQELEDIQRLNERKAKAKKSKQPFKKSGAELVILKRAEAERAAKNKVFLGTNNFANPKFGGKNAKAPEVRSRKRTSFDFREKGFSEGAIQGLIQRGIIDP